MNILDFSFFVCAGHGIVNGKKDPWAVSKFGLNERELNKIFGKKIIELLQKKKVFVQGIWIDSDAELSKKITYAKETVKINKLKNVIGLSIHCNSVESSDVRGFEVWFQKNNLQSLSMASYIKASYSVYFQERKVRWAFISSQNRLWWLYIDQMPWIWNLVELGFISNKEEYDFLIANVDRLSESIVHGILENIRMRNA